MVRIIYTGHQGRGPLHIFGRKLSMTVLNIHEVIGPLHIFESRGETSASYNRHMKLEVGGGRGRHVREAEGEEVTQGRWMHASQQEACIMAQTHA